MADCRSFASWPPSKFPPRRFPVPADCGRELGGLRPSRIAAGPHVRGPMGTRGRRVGPAARSHPLLSEHSPAGSAVEVGVQGDAGGDEEGHGRPGGQRGQGGEQERPVVYLPGGAAAAGDEHRGGGGEDGDLGDPGSRRHASDEGEPGQAEAVAEDHGLERESQRQRRQCRGLACRRGHQGCRGAGRRFRFVMSPATAGRGGPTARGPVPAVVGGNRRRAAVNTNESRARAAWSTSPSSSGAWQTTRLSARMAIHRARCMLNRRPGLAPGRGPANWHTDFRHLRVVADVDAAGQQPQRTRTWQSEGA